MSIEPILLAQGKAFHRRVQEDWRLTAEGTVIPEHTISLPTSPKDSRHLRHGRLDIFIGKTGDYVTIVEIKATLWDRIKPQNVSTNLNSHTRQVWRYVEKFLDVDRVSVCAGVIYPRSPSDPLLRQRIETYLNDRAMQVVWYENS